MVYGDNFIMFNTELEGKAFSLDCTIDALKKQKSEEDGKFKRGLYSVIIRKLEKKRKEITIY